MYFSFSALLSVLRQVKSLRSATWSVQSVSETQGSLTYSVRLLDGTVFCGSEMSPDKLGFIFFNGKSLREGVAAGGRMGNSVSAGDANIHPARQPMCTRASAPRPRL